MFIVILGGVALSSFRRNKLLSTLVKISPELLEIETQYVYFAETNTVLSTEAYQKLIAVLDGEPALPILPNGTLFLSVPRPGMISAWASKAIDILQNVGLNTVNRIERGIAYFLKFKTEPRDRLPIAALLHDRMTQVVLQDFKETEMLFKHPTPKPFKTVDIMSNGKSILVEVNQQLGLALSENEIDFLEKNYRKLHRNPTDVELMMFAQVNSEHCRHKIFRANWMVNGKYNTDSLFGWIQNTYQVSPDGILSAYQDNAAVMEGFTGTRFFANSDGIYRYHTEAIPIVIKVETHNHPTAISPFFGAATGTGGEIRDEACVGQGSRSKVGLVGFSVSHLDFSESPMSPQHIASALNIMLEGPIGAASFANEFGRPNLCGYFRTFEYTDGNTHWGYHKPIMIAGGMGTVRPCHIHKRPLPAGSLLIVLGGPALLIGLGGGAASSLASGTSEAELDFASVQRSNAEMERRAQEVIDTCTQLGKHNPILSIHDVGAGGFSNAFPELVHSAKMGAKIELRRLPNLDLGMSPLEIWCNEAQERFVLALQKEQYDVFRNIAERERCPFAVVGNVTAEPHLLLTDEHFKNNPIDLPLDVLFGEASKITRIYQKTARSLNTFAHTSSFSIKEAIERVLAFPTVADKSFLITIGDRTVGGLTARDQMVGPWQVPVADCAVTATSFDGYTGEAMAIGERTPVAIVNPVASARLAVGEAITNLASAQIPSLSAIRLSANWMAAAEYPGEDAHLYDMVKAIGEGLCPQLELVIPVGKDSLSMQTLWQENHQTKRVISPPSLIISAFAPVLDIRKSLTPQLRTDSGETCLILIDLGHHQNRLGSSVLEQVSGTWSASAPDLDYPQELSQFFDCIQMLNEQNLLLAYHDRSDGGLLATVCEMAFAGRIGVDLNLSFSRNLLATLFSEELGAVVQVGRQHLNRVIAIIHTFGLEHMIHNIGTLNTHQQLRITHGQDLFVEPLQALQKIWSETSFKMQVLRDNPQCAESEHRHRVDFSDPGITPYLTYIPDETPAFPKILKNTKPKIAILREQGVNSHIETAAALDRAGFTVMDIHMTDLIAGRKNLQAFHGLVAVGGFSYGDVLGAGGGWAKSILYHPELAVQFKTYFERDNTFTLGLCNGCQMLPYLKKLIPGADHWPYFVQNESEQFEARLSMVEIQKSPSIFFRDMEGSRLPIAIAHGEGRVQFKSETDFKACDESGLVALRFVDHKGHVTTEYPMNPNGSQGGMTGFTSTDGRATILMPHPERVFRNVQFSWRPPEWGAEDSPWMRMFYNARAWV